MFLLIYFFTSIILFILKISWFKKAENREIITENTIELAELEK